MKPRHVYTYTHTMASTNDLDLQLDNITHNRTRGVADVVPWCQKAAAYMFRDEESRKVITEWGVGVLRTLLLFALDNNDVISPVMIEWIKEHLMPCLFIDESGGIESRHPELTYLLLRAVFNCTKKTAEARKRKRPNATVGTPKPPAAPQSE